MAETENMDKKGTRGGKKNASKKHQSEDLTFELIQELGGTKEDLRLLVGIDDEVEDLDLAANDFESEPIKKDEVQNFMKKLGIFDHRPDTGKEPKKPKKLLIADIEDDSDNDNKEAKKAANEESDHTVEKKKKKKEKNKFKLKSDTESSELKEPENQIQGKKKIKELEASPESSKKKKKKEKNKFKVQHEEVSSTTSATGLEELLSHLKTHPQRTHLLVKPGDTWMDSQVKGGADEVTKDLIQQCEQFAAKLLEDEVELYKKQRDKTKKGESNWMRTVLTSGTLTDKMAALTLLVQESPTHNMAALDSLVAMTKKKGKREAMLASDTLKNLLVSDSSPLPDDRKLVAFDSRPLSTLWLTCSGNKDNVDRHLVLWYAEELLRQKYAAFVKALDVMSYDTLLSSKEKALAIIHSLLVSKPEQEEVLLPMLVNKLGDPNHKIASKASYLLIKLVEQHPNMKAIIVGEVERLVYRPNVAQRAQYYAMCFLNQIKLHKGDHVLASQLISIFFTFFKMYVTKGEVDSKMMAALLTGVNRAYPFAKLKHDFLSEQMTTLYKIVHIVNFNTSVQALMLLHQVIDPSNSESDRYFMALYRKLLDPALRTSAKQAQFLNLIYKSMKADIIEKRIKALMKRLLQAGALLGPNFLCGTLIVISEVLKEKPTLLAVKQLGKSTKKKGADDSILKKAAGEEVEESKADFCDSDDDEEERFVDLPVPPEFQEDSKETPAEADSARSEEEEEEMVGESGDKSALKTTGSSWNHRLNLTGKSGKHGYDAYQRNPLHCQAENECLWELQALEHHYHPSVAIFAQTILQGKSIEYSGDPLQDFTLMRFLDRFVYKNPKKKDAGEARTETVGSSSGKREQSSQSVPVNSAEFIEGGEEAVPEHERYLYRYFSQKAEQKKKQDDEDSEAGSVSDSEFDTFLDKYERQMDHDDLDDMDFGVDLAGKKGSKELADFGSSSDEDDADDVGGGGGLSDEEVDFGDDDDDELAAEFRREMEGLGDGTDDELDEVEDEDEDEGMEDDDLSGDELKQMMLTDGGKKRKQKDVDFDVPVEKKKKRKRDGAASMFAAADDFADILEGNMEASSMMGTMDDVRNTDKASAKQLEWESKRERQQSGREWRQKKRKGGKQGGPKGGKAFRGGRSKSNAGRRHQQGNRKRK